MIKVINYVPVYEINGEVLQVPRDDLLFIESFQAAGRFVKITTGNLFYRVDVDDLRIALDNALHRGSFD